MKNYVYVVLLATSFVSACNSYQAVHRSDKGKHGAHAPHTQTATNPAVQQPVVTPVTTPITDASVNQVPTSQCHKADPFICEVELAIWRHTNAYRKERGKAELAFGPKMGFVSRAWSESQAKRGFIGHSGFPSARYPVYTAEFPNEPKISMNAENVAYSGSRSTDAEAVAKIFSNMWWNSSGHRANMLGNHKTIGVGVFKKGSSTYYATQIFGKE